MNPAALAWALVAGNEARATGAMVREIREMAEQNAQAEIDALLAEYFPPLGPCACCGNDARHRVIDAIGSRWWAGDTIESLMVDYGIPDEAVLIAIRVYSDAHER